MAFGDNTQIFKNFLNEQIKKPEIGDYIRPKKSMYTNVKLDSKRWYEVVGYGEGPTVRVRKSSYDIKKTGMGYGFDTTEVYLDDIIEVKKR